MGNIDGSNVFMYTILNLNKISSTKANNIMQTFYYIYYSYNQSKL